jgi:hypothetical protein
MRSLFQFGGIYLLSWLVFALLLAGLVYYLGSRRK